MKIKFTAKERDTETGLDYFGARYFSAAQGRFTSPDGPFFDWDVTDPQSWNLYGYVRNSPLTASDPNGACSVKPGDQAATDDPDEPCVKPGDTSVTVTEKMPEQRDPAADLQAEMNRMTYEAWKRRQEENRPKKDEPLPEDRVLVLKIAGERAAHDLECVGIPGFKMSAWGAYAVNGREIAGFRSPVTGKLVGGYKSFAPANAAQGSSTFSMQLRDAIPIHCCPRQDAPRNRATENRWLVGRSWAIPG